MGYTINHHVIVSGWKDTHVEEARKAAIRIFSEVDVTPIFNHRVNGGSTFYVIPSGSKSGWQEQDKHLSNISRFMGWAEEKNLFNKYLIVSEHEEIEHSSVERKIDYMERDA